MAVSVTTTLTKTITLAPRPKQKLLTELRAYAELHDQLKAVQHAMEKHKAGIEAIRATTGEDKLELDGFKIAYVSPVRTSLNKEKLLASGVTMVQIEGATETKATKPYTKVSVPGDTE